MLQTQSVQPATPRARTREFRFLVALETVTGVFALIGGLLLMLAPDGALLRADPLALGDTPFRSWLVPGLFLFTCVGIGFVFTAFAEWRAMPSAWVASLGAGVGLVCFEGVEFGWLGFQPLEAVFAVVGLAVASLAVRGRNR